MTDQEFSDRIRSMIEHENILRDQRLNWLMASQGLLVVALGFSWDKDKYLVILLAVIGIIFCISIGANLYCNTLAIRKLANQWKEKSSHEYDGPPVIALRSKEITPRHIAWLYPWIYPWFVLPISLTAFWIFVLLYKVIT